MRVYRLLLSVLLALLVLVAGSVQAQADVTLQLVIPNFSRDRLDETIFAAFEDENPGVRVVLAEPTDGMMAEIPFLGSETYLDDLQAYAQRGDVLFMPGNLLNPIATETGFLLDLAPLADTDSVITDQYYPIGIESLRYGTGLYGLPISLNIIGLIYDTVAFDAAGLSYPTDNWTYDDIINAAGSLAAMDTHPAGLAVLNQETFLISSYGQSLVADAGFDLSPDLVQEDLIAFIERYEADIENGAIASAFQFGPEFDPFSLPMRIANINSANFSMTADPPTFEIAPLPGGYPVQANSLVVSAGTANPELAYALAKYLTAQPEIYDLFGADLPARQDASMEGNSFLTQSLERNQQTVGQGIPAPVFAYSFDLTMALSAYFGERTDDLRSALEEQQAQAQTLYQAAIDRQGTVLQINPPPEPVILAEGEVELTFGVYGAFGMLPNRQQWDDFIEQYVTQQAGVGAVNLELMPGVDIETLQTMDCLMIEGSFLDYLDLSLLSPVEPFFQADASIPPGDFLPGALEAVTVGDQVYALPLTIQPLVMQVNVPAFEAVGLPAPAYDWTVNDFAGALAALAPQYTDVDLTTANIQGLNTYLLLLMAAYGGLPVDYSTTPPAYDLTDASTLNAIRQVLDLAKDDRLFYDQLYSESNRGFSMGGGGGGGGNNPLMQPAVNLATQVNVFSNEISNRINNQGIRESLYEFRSFPAGQGRLPVSFTVTAGVISANTALQQECYNFISALSADPTLFYGMSARASTLADPALDSLLPADVVTFYREYADRLMTEDLVNVPFFDISGKSQIAQLWMNRAFDRYVLDDADLDAELTQAQANIDAFYDCAAPISDDPLTAFDEASIQAAQAQADQLTDCVAAVDPDFAQNFGR
jgi:ABC-type glycerol-3-phosphate transport system substrate-binding protein